jgi:hypothetical protein
MMPARSMSWWDGTAASAGTSFDVGMKNCVHFMIGMNTLCSPALQAGWRHRRDIPFCRRRATTLVSAGASMLPSVDQPSDHPKLGAAVYATRRHKRRIGLQSDVMKPDDEICYCYHVSMRKLLNFARRTRPDRPSRMTECLNAGTGCGWCIPILIKIAKDPDAFSLDEMTPEQYADKRQAYRAGGRPKHTFDAESEGADPA